MRPPRVAILALFFAASIFLFCRSISLIRRSPPVITTTTNPPKSQFRTFFSFTAPFTLFPPNAAISLTEDNSTFFPARPAAFGPPLASKGLSGQLWVGGGFAEDNLQDGEGQGEFGCSDVPGWDDGSSSIGTKSTSKTSITHSKSSVANGKAKISRRNNFENGPLVDRTPSLETEAHDSLKDDGTDDYLHEGLQREPQSFHEGSPKAPGHADIQSIQETAEITGKVVLLSRGGCGFLEKVKWAQRRGAIAVIVGDNQKGGPLIQMFARGDTSNVTIPAVFTAHTTAQLLSSLMQPGSFIEDMIDDNGNAALKVQQFDKSRKNKANQPGTITTPTPKPKATKPIPQKKKQPVKKNASTGSSSSTDRPLGNWVTRLFKLSGGSSRAQTRSRPPTSGRLDWVLVDDWSDEKDRILKTSMEKASKESVKTENKQPTEDSFQIGVQDWRDPDLVDSPSQKRKPSTQQKEVGKTSEHITAGKPDANSAIVQVKQANKKQKDQNGPKGGSITPGSGEYIPDAAKERQSGATPGNVEGNINADSGLMSKLFGEDDVAETARTDSASKQANGPIISEVPPADGVHEGLWVTITPTSSASPFFDTLLVLVISPLITLSVVYALLILRARIRRRRWRAPKSVVDRLPVRTYHTVASTPSLSPRLPSPTSSSPTTPLLQRSPSRPRPRSRTTTGIPDAGDLLRVDSALQSPRPPSRPEHEKIPGPSQWKKYMGRQVECVVCLEEYVDGISRVMSLPCGHEFHVDCITPWLTTRRRTCPICKGDVVRSLARGSPSSPRYEAYHDNSDDDMEASGSGSGSGNGAYASDRDSDVEQGILSGRPSRPRHSSRSEGWLNVLSSSFGAAASSLSGSSRNSRSEDRDR